jgi:hypothetical protein
MTRLSSRGGCYRAIAPVTGLRDERVDHHDFNSTICTPVMPTPQTKQSTITSTPTNVISSEPVHEKSTILR